MKAKKLMILGGNPETAALVSVANEMGIHTIVVDPVSDSPAKKVARESYEIDGLDVDALEKLAVKLGVDGVLVGVADILVPSYKELCERMGLPCFATGGAIKAFSSKSGFIEACKLFDVHVTPNFSEDDVVNFQEKFPHPLLIKPVDNGGGIGISICKDFKSFEIGINRALQSSKSNQVLIEKYMDCDDMSAYYSFVDGKAYLSATTDRYTSKKTLSGSPVCIGAFYPSKHEKKFLEEVHPKLLKMFSYLGIRDGVLNIQFFRDENGFYAYDPGFRLQGEGFHIHLEAAFGFDQRVALVNFALKHSDAGYVEKVSNNKMGDGFFACTVWVLLDAGRITKIIGLSDVMNLVSYKNILVRFDEGDCVSEEMLGTEKQVFCRIYLQSHSLTQLYSDVDRVSESLEVFSHERSIILDLLSSKDIRSEVI